MSDGEGGAVFARFIVGDVFDGLATLEDGSVDLVVTSPPFGWVRSYLPADHPDKAKEIGHEATPAEYIDTLLRVTAELRRVLAPHGSICIELGDTYAGSGGAGGDYLPGGLRDGQEPFVGSSKYARSSGWPLAKSKILIPELYRVALAYGINPLTGQESPAGRWRIRNVVTWCRPNPPVGALGDKWRPATSDIVVACTSDKRYWDDIATRQPYKHPNHGQNGKDARGVKGLPSEDGLNGRRIKVRAEHPAGAPLLDWWELPPGGYPGSHYAVYPPALVEPLIKAMAPPKVCRQCGEPSRRIVGEPTYVRNDSDRVPPRLAMSNGHRKAEKVNQFATDDGANTSVTRQVETLGWSDCGHDDWRPAVVLDPFAGSGTTLAVATGHGHDAIGIDLDERNYQLALERVGPMLLGPPERVESHLR